MSKYPRGLRRALEGRSALVTGAASGIGAALAEVLAALGARVWLTDIDPARLADTAARLDAPHSTLDVTDPAAFRAAVDAAWARFDGLDYLFNNAGVGLAGEVRDLTLADWDRVIDVNLRGTIHGVDAVYRRMIERGRGHIVNVASGAALAPRPGMVPYAAAKAGVVALSHSLRAEAAQYGVSVSVACPGYVATGIIDRTPHVGLDRDGLRAAIPIEPISAVECARRIVRGAVADRALIPVGAEISVEWRLARFVPGLVGLIARWRARQFARHRVG